MKLSQAQIDVLNKLSNKWMDHTSQHPKDAYNSRTIDILIKNGLVEEYYYRNFLGKAIRLTESGNKIINEVNK